MFTAEMFENKAYHGSCLVALYIHIYEQAYTYQYYTYTCKFDNTYIFTRKKLFHKKFKFKKE